MIRSGDAGFYQWAAFQFPVSDLNAVGTDNEFTFGVSAHTNGVMYDALRMEITNTSANPSVTGWDDYTYINGSTQVAQNDAMSLAATNSYTSQLPSLTWDNAGGSGDGMTWDTVNQNWNSGSASTTYSSGDTVTFNDNNNGHYSVLLNSVVTPGSVTVDNSSGNYTISGSGSIAGTGSLTKIGTSSLVLATSNSYSGGTNVNGGTLVVAVNGALPYGNVAVSASGTLKLGPQTGAVTVPSLTIASGGVVDIANNNIYIDYGSNTDPKATILGYLSSGANGGLWNGTGIISSTAAANPGYGVAFADGADGVDPNLTSGEIEVAYAQYGDITLQGLVNANDFHILASNFGLVVTGGWEDGDFLYTGTVNAEDFSLLTGNFSLTETGEDSSDLAAMNAFASANGLEPVNVPEPVSLALLCGASALGLRRRTRPR
jgi:autotransporter-associated beta strand protein